MKIRQFSSFFILLWLVSELGVHAQSEEELTGNWLERGRTTAS